MIVGGTTLALSTAGLAVATDGAEAQASIELGELNVEDRELRPDDGEVFAPWLLINGPIEWRTEQTPDKWEVFCLIFDGGGNNAVVGMDDGPADAREGSATYGLTAAVTAADFYGPSDFSVQDGEPTTTSVPIELAVVIRDADGGALVQARVSDTVAITVAPGGTQASIGGHGTVYGQMDQADATPTPPEGG